MTHTPSASSVAHGGEPGTLRPAALPADKGLSLMKVKPVEPSPTLTQKFDWKQIPIDVDAAKRAIQNDIEQRRERIARKLSV